MMRRETWHLTEALLFVHVAVFLMTRAEPGAARLLALSPGAVGARPWTVITFQFLHGGTIWFFFSLLILWIMARPLEDSWGSPRFLAFWAVSIAGAVVTALLFGQPLFGDIFLQTSLLFTFATLYPATEFLLFFVLPVKVKYLAVIGGVLLVGSSFLSYGLLGGIANAAGMSAGYVFFLATRRLPSRRKVAFKFKQARGAAQARAVVAEQEQKNRGWDPNVRAAVERASNGALTGEDRELLQELDAAVDPDITVCAPEDFGYIDDDICRGCSGFPECAARTIRLALEKSTEDEETDSQT